ncbi:hypothetical protein SO802_031961 [Lithocarpus litseifolius]|uniref:VQ domain-containing protein n=1 Tax=Lithocarpus litseifolius TaxID=425828 RepID=A0AAW2BQ85_9ROSI
MADNMASIESWNFRHSLADTWITDALQKSISSANPAALATDTLSPLLNLIKPDTTTSPTPTVSGLSGGSDPDTPIPKRQRNAIPVSGGVGKVSKRKSRASKRSQTTFITADAANFRQMVQQVTGVRFGNASSVPMVPILKPEPQRPGNRLPGGGGGGACLPTLDTSAFLLDHHQQQVVGSNSAAALAGGAGTGLGGSGGPLSFGSNLGHVSDGPGGIGSFGGGFDFDSFTNFPTLESWKVM